MIECYNVSALVYRRNVNVVTKSAEHEVVAIPNTHNLLFDLSLEPTTTYCVRSVLAINGQCFDTYLPFQSKQCRCRNCQPESGSSRTPGVIDEQRNNRLRANKPACCMRAWHICLSIYTISESSFSSAVQRPQDAPQDSLPILCSCI